jgi:DNA-binding NarL/FixJ family response regulator
MLHILLVTPRLNSLQSFAEALSAAPEVRLEHAGTGAEAVAAAKGTAPHLVIIDEELPDATPLELVQKLLTVNALINTAVVSPLPEDQFHEASEGLGILCRLTENPGPAEAHDLLNKLRTVLGGAA